MFKRIIALVIILVTFSTVSASALNMDVYGAYDECYTLYPDFIDSIIAQGTTKEKIIVFMKDVKNYFMALPETLTEDNFDRHIYDAINKAFNYRWNIKVRDALMAAYPDAVTKAMDGIITEEFVPVYETIKRYILGITTPVVTLSGSNEIYVHSVYLPEDVFIIVGFYQNDGTMLKAEFYNQSPLEPAGDYAVAYAFDKSSLSPVCNSYTLKITK